MLCCDYQCTKVQKKRDEAKFPPFFHTPIFQIVILSRSRAAVQSSLTIKSAAHLWPEVCCICHNAAAGKGNHYFSASSSLYLLQGIVLL